MKKFSASVQYNDLLGSIAADNSDETTARKWLISRTLISDDEYVLGLTMRVGENHGTHRDPVSVTFLVGKLGHRRDVPTMLKSSGNPLKVREVSQEMDVADFLGLFKRFAVTLSSGGLIEGQEYTTE